MLSTEKLEWKEALSIIESKWYEKERKEYIPNGAAYRRNWVMCEVYDNDIMVIHRHFKGWWNWYFKQYPNQGDPDAITRAFQKDFPINFYFQIGNDMYWLICKDWV